MIYFLEAMMIFATFVIYVLPTSIAFERRHHNVMPIVIINVLLGWTFVGWVCALAWSASHLKEV